MRTLNWAVAAALLAPAALGAPPALTIEPDGGPGSYHVKATFDAEAPAAVAEEVITDYDGLGRFVSSIRESRVVRKGADEIVIEQRGRGRYLFVTREIALTLAVRERPGRVDFRELESGQFERYEGSWRIEGGGKTCSVTYELTARPRESMGPGFAARGALKKNIRRQLEEVRAEIERRARAEGGEDHG